MKQNAVLSPACRSFFQKGAQATTTEAYTQIWIALINQIERGKHTLAQAQ